MNTPLNNTMLEQTLTEARDSWPNPPESDKAYILFYDIESLHNIFTVSIYDPKMNRLVLFYLCDDGEIEKSIDTSKAVRHILAKNKFINRSNHRVNENDISIMNLRDEFSHQWLCWMLGLAQVKDVNLTKHVALAPTPEVIQDADIRRTRFALLADTHPAYDYTKHHMIAGYNSNEYDMTMMANYFYQMESSAFSYNNWIKEQDSYCREDKKNSDQSPSTIERINQHYANLIASRKAFQPTTAKKLREFNDELFGADRMSQHIDRGSIVSEIRLAMLNSGRHLDVALLNEKAKFVALKSLCGMLGFQIMESEKLVGPNARVDNVQDVYELFAYNTSDTVNLYRLFRHPLYSKAFDLKASLIHLYPETVFKANPNNYGSQTPHIACNNVNPWRLRIDSTSAQIVAKMLAPYKSLKDIDSVSFLYPSQHVVDEEAKQGNIIKRINVLDYVEKKFKEVVTNPTAIEKLEDALAFYRNIEGKNFNDLMGDARVLNEMPKTRLNIPYFLKDGTETSCYVTFSTGGIHGAELNAPYAMRKRHDVNKKLDVIRRVKAEFPNATEMRNLCGHQQVFDEEGKLLLNSKGEPLLTKDLPLYNEEGEMVLTPTGRPAKHSTKYIRLASGEMVLASDVLVTGSTKTHSEYKSTELPHTLDLFIDKEAYDPVAEASVVQNTPNKEFTFTSIDSTIHEDFTSYYPSLLTNMSAFYNPALGKDRYVAMYDEKNELGRKKKAAEAQGDFIAYDEYDLLQKGTKLGLNSASGAADSMTGRQIRMNNTIISMRIIGQLFTWWIAQAQAFDGGKIVSTNTDGVYVVMDIVRASKILEDESSPIRVEIEPEEVLLVSKDANNRLELTINKGANTSYLTSQNTSIAGASGGTLACYKGPNPGNALAHAAVLDYVLVHYLSELAMLKNNAEHQNQQPALSIYDPFNDAHARRFMDGLLGRPLNTPETALPWNPPKEFSYVYALTMFQTMIKASRGSMSYPFAVRSFKDNGEIMEYEVLQDCNRVFFVREDAHTGSWSKFSMLKANAAKVPPAALEKMAKNGTKPIHGVNKQDDPWHAQVAYDVLSKKGFISSMETPMKLANVKPNDPGLISRERELKVTRINGVDPQNKVIIVNEDIECMEEADAAMILDALDLDVYMDMARTTFENNWRNKV